MRPETGSWPRPPRDPQEVPYFVAGGASGSAWVAGTGLAATATGEVPEVGGTAVTAQALDVGEAWALPTAWVTVAAVSGRALPGICAQQVAGTACASRDGDTSQGVRTSQGEPPPVVPSHPPTHGDSSVGQPAHGSQAYSGHSAAPPCGVSSAGIAPSGGHRHPGPWGQCSHCTHMVGTRRLALMGPQSARGHKLRIAALPTVGRGGVSAQASCSTLVPRLHLPTHLCSLPGSGTRPAASTHPCGRK